MGFLTVGAQQWLQFAHRLVSQNAEKTHDVADDEVSCLAVQVLAKRDTRETQELRKVGEC